MLLSSNGLALRPLHVSSGLATLNLPLSVLSVQVWLGVWVLAAGGGQGPWSDMDRNGVGPGPTRLPGKSEEGAHADRLSVVAGSGLFLPPALLLSEATC